MNVQVRHFLTPVATGIYDRAKAIDATLFFRELRDKGKHFTQERLIFRFCIRQGRDMTFGDQQEMHWSLRIDISKSENILILIHLLLGISPLAILQKMQSS